MIISVLNKVVFFLFCMLQCLYSDNQIIMRKHITAVKMALCNKHFQSQEDSRHSDVETRATVPSN